MPLLGFLRGRRPIRARAVPARRRLENGPPPWAAGAPVRPRRIGAEVRRSLRERDRAPGPIRISEERRFVAVRLDGGSSFRQGARNKSAFVLDWSYVVRE